MTDSFAKMNWSLPVDIRLLPYEVKQNAAYAKCLTELGILTKAELSAIENALKQILAEYEEGRYFPLPEDEDIHTLVEKRLTEITGEAGKKIHTGRSRNEEIVTEVKMYLQDEASATRGLLGSLIQSLAKLAEENIDTVMPGYTHMQHAQPVSLAHYLCSFAWSMKDSSDRLKNILSGTLSNCPMGSGAFAGSAFPFNRKKMAQMLGFERATPNSVQAVSSRDELLEISSVLAMVMVNLSRYAEDLIVWSSHEFGFVELDDSVSTGSSMMPQKKNPDSLELIRGKSARVIGDMTSLFTLMKGMPLTYSRDMQEDKHALFDLIDETKLCLKVFCDVMQTIKFNKDKMSAQIENYLFATDMADYLTKKGNPFRESHRIVAGIVREASSCGAVLQKYPLEELKKHSPLFEKDVFELFSTEHSLKLREIYGGTGVNSVKAQIAELLVKANLE